MNGMSVPRILVIGPLPPPYNGWAHVVSSFLNLPSSEEFDLIPYDTKLPHQLDVARPRIRSLGSVFGHAASLARIIRSNRPSLAILFTGYGGNKYLGGSFWRDLLLLWLCHRSGLPTVIRFFGGRVTRKIQEFPAPLRGIVLRQLSVTRAFLVETQEMVDHLQGFFPGIPTYRVPNFVNVDELPIRTQRVPTDPTVKILYLGNMIPSKGVETILASVDQVCDRHAAAQVHFVGGERVRGYLNHFRSLVSRLRHPDLVYVHGMLPRKEAHALASQCQIFAFPTQYYGEGQPAALLEAMGIGLVPVATRWRGVAEIIDDGVNGFLLDRPDSEQLAALVGQLHGDPHLYQSLSHKARETVLGEYDAKPALDQYRKIIAAVAGN